METKKTIEEILENFNPNENGLSSHGIFGLPFGVEESKVVLIPVPWEATVSYGSGTSNGPKAMLDASQHIDLYDQINPNGWKKGMAMEDIPADIFYNNQQLRIKVLKYLDEYVEGEINTELQEEINNECSSLVDYVKSKTSKLLEQDKIVGVVGGDHSVPLGYLEALALKYDEYGILHIDAHADLRDSYEGLKYSHASIFFNALKIKNIKKLVQVGVRDMSEGEQEIIDKEKERVSLFSDYDIRKDLFGGKTWSKKCDEIVKNLPKNVYISFDIDGLAPYLSPNTGTPVLGGLTLDEVVFLIEKIIDSKRKIIGFDLCEVSPGENNQWDGNVGSRVLYKLCLLALKSNK